MATNSVTKRAGNSLAAGLVVAAMIIAALSLWTVIPLTWIWIGSNITDTQTPSGGPYMIVFGGIVASIVVVSWILSRLNRLYVRITGSRTVGPIRPNWLKSLRDSEVPNDPTVLETVIVASVVLAGLSAGAWFIFLAGSPLPNQ